MQMTHTITPEGAQGQHDARYAFAYRHSGKACARVGTPYFLDTPSCYGTRQLVVLEDGTEGYVMDQELEAL